MASTFRSASADSEGASVYVCNQDASTNRVETGGASVNSSLTEQIIQSDIPQQSTVHSHLLQIRRGTRDGHSKAAEPAVLPYLGEELSVHEGAASFLLSRGRADSMSRAVFLEGLSAISSNTPCMLKMPVSRSYTQLGDAFEAIPPYSWILPLIVACCPSQILRQLLGIPSIFASDSDDEDAACDQLSNALSVSASLTKVTSYDQRIEGFLAARSPTARPRVASDGDRTVRQGQGSPSLRTFYHHRSLSSRPPFATALLSRPEHARPLSNVIKKCRSNPLLFGLDAEPSTVPPPPSQSIAFPPTWRTFGVVLLNKDPAWRPWEPKMVVLLDNYLFECTADGSAVIGFAQLSDARVSKRRLTDAKSLMAGHFALRIVWYTLSSQQKASQSTFWLTVESEDRLNTIAMVLSTAAKLRVEDVFDIPGTNGGEDGVLGRGRFNEVKLARRRDSFQWRRSEAPTGYKTNVDQSLTAHSRTNDDYGGDDGYAVGVDSDVEVDHDVLIFGDLDRSSGENEDALSCSEHSAATTALPACSPLQDFSLPPFRAAPCALKLVSKEAFWERVRAGKERADAMVREVLAQVLLTCQQQAWWHPCLSDCPSFPIVQIFGVFESAHSFVMELELMEQMDLFDRLAADGPMSESQVRAIMAQMVTAIMLCNKNGIAHRDIKLSNITFPSGSLPPNARGPLEVKLADFGMAGFLGSDRKLRGRCGTPGYVAPEILLAGVNEAYDLNVDMFSMGVVAYTLLCGYEPFYGDDNAELMHANKIVDYQFHAPEWDAISEDAKDWIAKALAPTAERRLQVDDARRHPWLQGLFFGKSTGFVGGNSAPSPIPTSRPPAPQCSIS